MSDLKVNSATLEFVKKQQAKQRKQRVVVSAAGLVLVASISVAGYLGWTSHKARQEAAAVQALVAEIKPGDRSGWQKMRAAVDRGEISRDKARDAMEAARDAEMQKTVDGYFKLPAKERDDYLDKLIDDQQKRMADWQRDRPTTQPTTRPQREGREGGPTDAQREERSRARSDNQSPTQRAQRGEFMAARRARMAARGITMPAGGRGGPGGGR